MTPRTLATRSSRELTGTGGKDSPRPRTHRAGLLLALWFGTGWLLLRLAGALTVPLGSTKAVSAWLEQTDPSVMAAATLRLVALALCAYLAAATALVLLASLVRWRPATASAGRLLPAVIRRMILGTAGVGLTGTIVSPAVSPALVAATPDEGKEPADRTAVMVKLEPASPSTTTTASSTTTSPATTPPPASTTSTTVAATAGTNTTGPSAGRSTGPAEPAAEAPATNAPTWTVQPGDSFWSIADEIVTEQHGSRGRSSPTDAEIARYWRVLIEANRDRLADRRNPDLLIPGQELYLPQTSSGKPQQ